MKIIHTLLLAGAAALVFAATPADAGQKKSARTGADTYKVVTHENGKKITTTYKAVGTRKVGMVGNRPYGVNKHGHVNEGGEYYTETGVPYYADPTDKLTVRNTGSLNR